MSTNKIVFDALLGANHFDWWSSQQITLNRLSCMNEHQMEGAFGIIPFKASLKRPEIFI